jgi:hypothetical protein
MAEDINQSSEPDSGITTDVELLEKSGDARNMAMLCHLFGLVGFIGPLVIWLNEKDKHEFVNMHGRAVMNYQVSMMLYVIGSWLLCFVFIGIPILLALIIMHIIFVIMGTVKASQGRKYDYPIAIGFLK